jgi:Rrf2 family transcriptional regulator, iron-sulfur cluster assembly transcription factor
MKLTSHEEYGFRCLVKLGSSGGALTIPEISDAEGISRAYVAKLMRILRKGGFVRSVRGNVGGYSLARPAGEIVVGEVLAVLGGKMFETDFCESHSGQSKICTHSTDCSIRTLWKRVQVALDDVLGKTTLQDVLRSEPHMTGWLTTLATPDPGVAAPQP